MNKSDVIHAWAHILAGYKPFLSIEITRECPLRCPGCYAYDDQHVGGGVTLRDLADFRGEELVRHFLAVVDEHRPMHLSIVGGDPLVRFRELEAILPALESRGIHIQLVTSAFRQIPAHWASIKRLNVVVSVDGLQPEHDPRRKPATYDRILKNIVGHKVSIHCTVTSQMMARPTYISEFLEFWTPRDEVKRVWFSTFTPQLGDDLPEMLSPEQRSFLLSELLRLRPSFPKLDMEEDIVRELASPPRSPRECIFAQTTETVSADLRTRITPCQFGGRPDCSQCGCIASMGLASLGHKKLGSVVSIGSILHLSNRIGGVSRLARSLGKSGSRQSQPPLDAEPNIEAA